MRHPLLAGALALAVAAAPTTAHAAFISPFLIGMAAAAGIPGAMSAGVWAGSSAGLAMAGFNAGGFILGMGGSLLSTALTFGANYLMGQMNKPSAEDVTSTVKSPIPVRRMLAGKMRVAGAVGFTGVNDGEVHYLVHHGESECVTTINHWFLDVPLELGVGPRHGAPNSVLNEEYTNARGHEWFTIQAFNGTLSQTVSTLLSSSYSEWDSTHRGIGCAYTVVKGWPISLSDRHVIFKYEGPLGSLGVPTYFREGLWGRFYDPRLDSTRVIGEDEHGEPVYGSGSHRVDNPASWGASRNAALIIATYRIHRDGWAKPPSSVNWEMIAKAADICDQPVVGRDSQVVARYTLATALPFNERRIDAEKRMLAACDGMRFFDEEGRWFIRVGYYEPPDVTLRDNDIVRIRILPNADGENDHNAFVAKYTDPRLNYSTQPSAPWFHPDHYQEGVTPTLTATLDLPEVDAHNQAARLCKAAGTRLRSPVRLEMIAGWRGLKLRKKRFCAIALGDTVVDGHYEIMDRREQPDGMHVHLVLVKTSPGNWDLLPGEEGPLPTYDNTLTPNPDLPAPTTFSAFAVSVSGGVSLAATFDQPANASHVVTVEYRRTTESTWYKMVSVTDDGRAYADRLVVDGASYRVRAYTESAGGSMSDYAPNETGSLVVATADMVAPGPVTGAGVTPGTGDAQFVWTGPNSPNYKAARVYVNSIDDFATAALVATVYGVPNLAGSATVPLAAGTHYGWIVSINASEVEGDPVATGPFTVT